MLILKSFSLFKLDNETKMQIPIKINIKCLIKKQYELVFNLSDAIKEVDASEKNKPKKNKDKIKNKMNLSIFFHQL